MTAPLARALPAPSDNIQPMRSPAIEVADPELQALYESVVAKAQEAIGWYVARKNRHKRWALLLRGSALVLAAVASVVPVAFTMFPESWNSARWIPLASVLAAIGAGCIGLDRFFGFSGGWMRYVIALLELQAQLDTLQFAWARRTLETRGAPARDSLEARLELLQLTLGSVNQALKSETVEWMNRFSGSLQELEKSLMAQRAAASAPVDFLPVHGALKVHVENVAELEGREYTVRVGDSESGPHTGSTKAFTGLPAGQLLLRVTGSRQGAPVSAEDVVHIRRGETASVTVVLA
jgi:hypothetical protein